MKSLLRYVPELLIFATSALILGIIAYLISVILYVAGPIELSFLFSSSSTFEFPAPFLFGIILTKLLLLATLLLLLKTLFTLKNSSPFERPVIKRFYIVGIIVLILPFLDVTPYIVTSFFESYPYWQFAVVDSMVNRIAGYLITGILVLSLAHVLKSGLSIFEEQKLTV